MREDAGDSPAGDAAAGGRRRIAGEPVGFDASLTALEAAVGRTCEQGSEWQARVAGGIRAALGFSAQNPVAARTLMLDSRHSGAGGAEVYTEMIGRFTRMLTDAAPGERLPGSSDGALVGAIASVVGERVRTDSLDRLGESAPDLIQLALMPYVGFDEARRWSSDPAN